MEQPHREPSKKPRLTDEEIKAKLKEAARKRRPWTPGSVLVAVLLVGLPLGLVAWWFWPRPLPPHALVVAPDVLSIPGANITLTAYLVRDPSEDPTAELAGWPIHFNLLGSGTAPPQTKITDPGGIVRLQQPAPGTAGMHPYKVSYTAHRYYSGEDTGRLFVIQPDTALLLVDLALDVGKQDLAKWQSSNIHDVPLDQEVGAALKQAAKKGQAIVYLACAEPPTYRKMRGWLQLHANRGQLPDGPVLGCGLPVGKSSELELPQLAQQIKKPFTGKFRVLSTQPRLTARYLQAGLTVLEIPGPADPPPGVIPVNSWRELAELLP